jgi:hypothetical protein
VIKNSSIGNNLVCCNLITFVRFLFFGVVLLLPLTLSAFKSDEEGSGFKLMKIKESTCNDDSILVNLIIEGVGNYDLEVIYTNNNLLYINIEDLFKTLNIACVNGSKGETLEGVIGNKNQIYLIDYLKKEIKLGGKIFIHKNGLLKEAGIIYMESSLLKEAFGIALDFNYRSLTIKIKADFELPFVKKMKLEKARNNISKLKGEIIADTLVNRNYHLFRLGILDWSVASFKNWNGSTNNLLGLNAGAELLCGEANIAVNYNDQFKFNNRQLQYLWRWVDNDKTFIKQAQIGKINVSTISTINSPIVGAVIRNSPTIVRKAKGSYTINEFTEPNWTVELYINNALVDFTTADDSGGFMFKVPIVYGFTTLKLKYYGPLGEEHTEEREINVPYTVMPADEFEYGLSAGILEDDKGSRYGKGEFNYGINRMLTVGGGVEYLSSLSNGGVIPFAKATLQPFSKLTLNGEYAYGVRSKGLLNYYLSKDVLLELDYTKYVDGQDATLFSASEERRAKLSVPFRNKKINGFIKLDYTQLVYKTFNYYYANLMFSTYYKQFGINTSTQLNRVDNQSPYVVNDLLLSYRLKKNYILRSSVRYNVSDGLLMSYKAEIEKRMSKGNFSASYEKNALNNMYFLNVGYKYYLPFARTDISASYTERNIITSISAQGSLTFGGGNDYIHTSNNSSMSKGGILLYPFLDLNQNGVFDKEEHLVKITNVKVNGGNAIFNEKDFSVCIPNLNAFSSYSITFNDNDLENIAWRFKDKIYKVLIDPNQFKRIDIPIVSMGEVSGMVYKDEQGSQKGISRISIKIYKKNSTEVVAETLSESDGYFNILGLKFGEYMACVDSVQLSNLDFMTEPPCKYFEIKPMEDGDIVDSIDFVLRAK